MATANNIITQTFASLTTEQAAAKIGVSPKTLKIWRCTKKENIAYYKIGRKVFYKEQDLLNWQESKRVAYS